MTDFEPPFISFTKRKSIKPKQPERVSVDDFEPLRFIKPNTPERARKKNLEGKCAGCGIIFETVKDDITTIRGYQFCESCKDRYE